MKKILSLALAIIMLIGILPTLPVYAKKDAETPEEHVIYEPQVFMDTYHDNNFWAIKSDGKLYEICYWRLGYNSTKGPIMYDEETEIPLYYERVVTEDVRYAIISPREKWSYREPSHIFYVIKNDNSLWRIGIEDTLHDRAEPIEKKLMDNVKDVKIYGVSDIPSVFVLKTDNTVWAFGAGANIPGAKQISEYGWERVDTPKKILSDVSKIISDNGVFAVKNDNTLWALSRERIWFPEETSCELPNRPEPPSKLKENVADVCGSFVLETNGNLYEIVKLDTYPQQIGYSEVASGVKKISAGDYSHDCRVIKNDNTLWKISVSVHGERVEEKLLDNVKDVMHDVALDYDGWMWNLGAFPVTLNTTEQTHKMVRVSSLSISGDTSVMSGKETELTAIYYDKDGNKTNDRNITWALSEKDKKAGIVKLTSDGNKVKVKGLKQGKVKIIAIHNGTGEKISVDFTVTPKIDDLKEKKATVSFSDYEKGRNAKIDITHSNKVFTKPSTIYNHDLAKVCSVLSAAAYKTPGKYVESENWRDNNIYRALEDLDFDKIESYNYSDKYFNDMKIFKTSGDKCGFMFAEKYADLGNGKVTRIIAIIVRGTEAQEWYDDFHMRKPYGFAKNDNVHYSFKNSADEIYRNLQKYLKKQEMNYDDVKFLITGHSRGAAAANMLAATVTDAKLTDKENIYAYCFATPNHSTAAYSDLTETGNHGTAHDKVKYKNIWNIVNPEDFVPYVPFMNEGWRFGKWGTTLYLPNASYSENYSKLLEKMQALFSSSEMMGRKYETYENIFDTYDFIQTLHSAGRTVDEAYNGRWPGKESLIDYFNKVAGFLGDNNGLFLYLQIGADLLRREGAVFISSLNPLLPVNLPRESLVSNLGDYSGSYGRIADTLIDNGKDSQRLDHSHHYATYISWMYSCDEKDFVKFSTLHNKLVGKTYSLATNANVNISITNFKGKKDAALENGEIRNTTTPFFTIYRKNELTIVEFEKTPDSEILITLAETPKNNPSDKIILVEYDSKGKEKCSIAYELSGFIENDKLVLSTNFSDLKTDKENMPFFKNGTESIKYSHFFCGAFINILTPQKVNWLPMYDRRVSRWQ